jgi:hypothetical protein
MESHPLALGEPLSGRPNGVADEADDHARRTARATERDLPPHSQRGDVSTNPSPKHAKHGPIRPEALRIFKSCRPHEPERSCGGAEEHVATTPGLARLPTTAA